MAQFRDSIEMKVIIQGTEAINELGKLEAEAKDLRLSLKDIAKENEGFKQLEVSAKNLEKQYSKLDETLKTHTSTQTISKNKVDELTTKIQELEQAEVKDEKQIKELNKQREFHNRLLTNSTDNIENTNLRLAANAAEMKKVQSELKTTAKFTQEYIDTNAKIAGAEQKIKELREEYGLTAMTMQQLRKYQGELNRELDNVTFGTQAYKDLKIKIQEVSNTILSQKNDVKTVTQDFKVLVATVGLAGMTIEQLGDYQKELNQELKGVVFGTDAYKNLKNRIQDVNNAIENQQADLKTTTKYFKELISIVGISGLNIEQLADYQKELNQELNGVVFGTQAYKDLKNKIQEVNGVIENQKADLKASTQDFKALRAAVGLAGMTIEQLGDYQKQLNQELNGVVFGTAAYKDLKNRIQEVSGVIKNQQKDLQDTRTGWQKFKDEIKGFGVATLGNIGGEIAMRAFDGMTQALVGTVSQAAKLSDELADIQRFTGLSTEETKKLNSELSALNTRTGTGDLREITMIGGQLGVAKEEILGFVTSIDKANVALSKEFGGSAEAVANALGKIKNLFAETKNMKFGEAMERIGSALTAAGASSSASAPQISDFAQRLGAIGELGPKLTQTLGLGTALLDLGLSSEIAASGLQALFITAGKEAESFAKQIGISVEEFKKLQNNDPNKMLIDLAKSFKGLDNDEVLAGLLRMKITSGETVKVMALLKDNTEKVSAAQTLMANEFANNTKLQDAFNAKMSTFGAQVDLAKKEINGLVAGLTSALLPAMTKIVEKTVAFVIILKELPKFLKDNREVIATLVFALIGFNSSLIATQANILRTNFNFVVLNATMRAATLLMPIITTATAAWNAVLALNPLGLVIIAIAALVVGMTYLYNTNEKVKQGIDTLWEAYKTFVGAVIDFWVNVLTLDFSGAFDTLITAFKKVKNIFAEGITPTINEPVGSKLQSNEFKQQQQKQNKKDAGGLLFSFEPEEKPKQNDLEYMSYEDAALIAANKKRAADGAAADKAENDKKDAAAKERNNKLKEDRLKAEKDANEAIAALKLELLKDEEQKEIAQAKLANAKESEFNKALEMLQSDFKILPVGVAQAGAWKYSFIYEVVSRYYPDLPERARKIGEREARAKLVELFFESVGVAQAGDVNKLFGWKKDLTARTIASLVEKRTLVESEHPKHKGQWLALPKLTK